MPVKEELLVSEFYFIILSWVLLCLFGYVCTYYVLCTYAYMCVCIIRMCVVLVR